MKTYINDKEIARILHDWKYRGFVVENVFTEEDTEEIKSEMNRLRIERNEKETTALVKQIFFSNFFKLV